MAVDDIAREGYGGSSLATTRFNPDDERYGGHIDDSGLDTYTLMINLRGEAAARFDAKRHAALQRELAYTPSTSMVKTSLAKEFGTDGASHTEGIGYEIGTIILASIAKNQDWVSVDGKGALGKDDHGC